MFKLYTYREAVKEDVREYIRCEFGENVEDTFPTRDEMEEFLNDELWDTDSVTGNASGSYTCQRWLAQSYVQENGLNHLCAAVQEGFIAPETIGQWFLHEDWEAMDVTIRCYLLGECISEVLDDMESQGYWDREPDTAK